MRIDRLVVRKVVRLFNLNQDAEALLKEIARAQGGVQRRAGRQQQNAAHRVLAGKGLNRRQLLPVVAQDLRQTGRLFADIGHHRWYHFRLPLK